MNVREALKGQYRAALRMLKDAVVQCPPELWDGGPYPVPFWRVAYHTLYGTHLYLQPDEAAFRPWKHHRDGYDDLPWPPGSGTRIDNPYTKEQILEYWAVVAERVDADVDRLDFDAAESGFPWHRTIPKFEHQIHNIRHIQHHTALLIGRLRGALGSEAEVRWRRTNGQMFEP